MNNGFYIMHRGWMKNPAFADEPFSRRDAWVWLIEHAVYSPQKFNVAGRAILLRRGQFCASVRKLAEEWQWTAARVQRFLGRLKTDTMIDTVSDTGRMIITICNYDVYQVQDSSTDTAAIHEPIQQRYSSDTQKKEGKERKEDNIIPIAEPEAPRARTHEAARNTVEKREPISGHPIWQAWQSGCNAGWPGNGPAWPNGADAALIDELISMGATEDIVFRAAEAIAAEHLAKNRSPPFSMKIIMGACRSACRPNGSANGNGYHNGQRQESALEYHLRKSRAQSSLEESYLPD